MAGGAALVVVAAPDGAAVGVGDGRGLRIGGRGRSARDQGAERESGEDLDAHGKPPDERSRRAAVGVEQAPTELVEPEGDSRASASGA